MKFLTSMMLLGLTKAQLDVYRAKAFTIGTLTPLDRLLNLGSLATDNLVLEVKCDDEDVGSPTNKREFWYNDVTSDTIGKAICPSPYGEEGDGVLVLANDQHDGMCPDQLNTYPDANEITI